MSDVTVSAHQLHLNLLPGMSVMGRLMRADVIVWLDCAQYVRHSFVNRNRLRDGQWFTVPVNEHDTYAPLNRVRIADPTGRQREKIARRLEHEFGDAAAPFADELRKPYELLIGLNYALVQRLFDALGVRPRQFFQSMLDPHHPVPVVSEDECDLAPVRERFPDWCWQLGGSVWLAGPSKHHGPVEAFEARGCRVEYFEWDGPNPSAVELLRDPAAHVGPLAEFAAFYRDRYGAAA